MLTGEDKLRNELRPEQLWIHHDDCLSAQFTALQDKWKAAPSEDWTAVRSGSEDHGVFRRCCVPVGVDSEARWVF